ncbi:monocarboxylate transporter 12-like isoform X2 [Scylla paramamosain]|uniref:monocarboxylate transporter 12-like isoform X2 n=1 Tax=Scylla paramamosain TaxID=85552 RepID=UPI003082D7E7
MPPAVQDSTGHSSSEEEHDTAHSSGEEQHGTAHSSGEEQEQGQNEGHQPIHAMIQMSLCPESSTPPSARDRGYAWVVVVGVFWINTLCAGYIKSFGITYLLLLEHFPDASGAAAGLIIGLLMGTRGLLTPLMGAMAVKIGPRRSILTGTLLVTLGLLLAIPKLSIHYMAATLGGLVGIGICMSETPGMLLVTDYFMEKLSFANGIRASGNPMGGILFSPMVVFLNDQFGLQGTFILLAGIMMHIAIFGMLMRPVELQEQILHRQHVRKTQAGPGCAEKGNMKAAAVTHKPFPKKALDFTLLWNPQYLIYLVMVLFSNLSIPQFLLYLPAYGYSIGLNNYQNSIISSYMSATDCIFRISCGFLVQKLNVKKAYIFTAGSDAGLDTEHGGAIPHYGGRPLPWGCHLLPATPRSQDVQESQGIGAISGVFSHHCLRAGHTLPSAVLPLLPLGSCMCLRDVLNVRIHLVFNIHIRMHSSGKLNTHICIHICDKINIHIHATHKEDVVDTLYTLQTTELAKLKKINLCMFTQLSTKIVDTFSSFPFKFTHLNMSRILYKGRRRERNLHSACVRIMYIRKSMYVCMYHVIVLYKYTICSVG